MTRRAFPYTPFQAPKEGPRTPMDCPPLDFRNHYKEGTRVGEAGNTHGNRAMVVAVQDPHDSTAGGPRLIKPLQGESGTTDPSIPSNVVTGGVVKGYITNNNSIRKAYLVSRNLHSPTSHANDPNRLRASGRIPVPAVQPSKDINMPPKLGKRGTGGNFTIPAPQVSPSWPTSAQWLRSRFGG